MLEESWRLIGIHKSSATSSFLYDDSFLVSAAWWNFLRLKVALLSFLLIIFSGFLASFPFFFWLGNEPGVSRCQVFSKSPREDPAETRQGWAVPCLILFKLAHLRLSFVLSLYSSHSSGTGHLPFQQSALAVDLHTQGLPSSRLMGGFF